MDTNNASLIVCTIFLIITLPGLFIYLYIQGEIDDKKWDKYDKAQKDRKLQK